MLLVTRYYCQITLLCEVLEFYSFVDYSPALSRLQSCSGWFQKWVQGSQYGAFYALVRFFLQNKYMPCLNLEKLSCNFLNIRVYVHI